MAEYDAYHRWLGIPPDEQPPSHYRLLGVPLFEADAEVIRNAADRQRAHVKRLGVKEYEKIGQDLMNEIETAKICLLRPEKKAAYDEDLRQQIEQQEERVGGETLLIGSDKNCDIVVDLPTVSGVHCSVTRRQEKVILRDLKSTNGTRVNFKSITRPTKITPADLIFLGRDTRLKLPLTYFPESMRHHKVGFVGRSDQCEIPIDDHTVSAFHARITFDDDVVLVEDLESTNGTLVGGPHDKLRRIEPLTTVVLNDFDQVAFGKYQMTVESFILKQSKLTATWIEDTLSSDS